MSSKCSFTCICGIVLPLSPSATTVYARFAFYSNLRFTLCLQSAFYTQSAFYPWSTVCSPQSAVCVLHWPIKISCLSRDSFFNRSWPRRNYRPIKKSKNCKQKHLLKQNVPLYTSQKHGNNIIFFKKGFTHPHSHFHFLHLIEWLISDFFRISAGFFWVRQFFIFTVSKRTKMFVL